MSGLFSSGGNSDSGAMHGEFMAFAADDAALLSLRGWAERQGYPQASVQLGGPDLFAQMLESAAPPKMAIVDLDGQADPASCAARLISLCGGGAGECKLVFIGTANDVALYRRILVAGAVDYLVKPLTSETLNQALVAALRGNTGGKPTAKEARIVTFVGARGGVGASTIALNAGWFMAHELGRATVLLDLDLQFGTSSLALDLEPGRGLRDIVGSPHRVDALMIASSIVPESDLFSVLGAEEAVDEVVQMDGGAITALLKEMKNNFDVILVDLPRALLPGQKRLLAASHEIVIVSDLTLAGIRDTLRIKSAVTSLGTDARLTILASRASASHAGQIDRATFEKGIQGKIDAVIVEDAAALAAAANAGKALGEVAQRAAVTRCMRELALRLAQAEDAGGAKGSFLGKLFGKKNGGKGSAKGKG
jgi:pilus assembly protein CpaE